MRKVTEHKVNPANDVLDISVVDEPGPGGANHAYVVSDSQNRFPPLTLGFQNGPIGSDGTGVNGITQEVLLSIVADRLRSFQQGEYACRENALALTKVEEALHWLHHRTKARMERGVEGTHTI
jgi:hypothetical protein